MATEHDHPVVLIVESCQDIAVALQEVALLAHCHPRTTAALGEPVEWLRDGPVVAIVVRVAAYSAKALPALDQAGWPDTQRPTIVALASSDEETAEAERLGCQVILREPRHVLGLYETLRELALSHPR